jgi:hypothetical protein
LLKKFERFSQPVVHETFVCPISRVHHLETNIGVRLKSLNAMIFILSVQKHLSMSYQLLLLLAASFYAKKVVQSTRLVHRRNLFRI